MKKSADLGDGTFDGSAVEPIKTGYPVLVVYGVNGYPYVKDSTDPGFNSGLGNWGGRCVSFSGRRITITPTAPTRSSMPCA